MVEGFLSLVEKRDGRWRIRWGNFILRFVLYVIVAGIGIGISDYFKLRAGNAESVIALGRDSFFFGVLVGLWQTVLLAEWLSKRTKVL